MWQFTKETKTTAKMGIYAQKSENCLWKLVVAKERKPSVKTKGSKNSLYSIWTKVWPVLTENQQNVDYNNIKIDKFKNHRNFLNINTFNNIRDIRKQPNEYKKFTRTSWGNLDLWVVKPKNQTAKRITLEGKRQELS